MSALTRLVAFACRALLMISAVMLSAMLIVVLADVLSRALFRLSSGSIDVTFTGGIELIRFSLLFAILYALPWCLDRSQVVVDLFTERLSDRTKAALQALCFAGYTLLGLAMSVRFWHSIQAASVSGETTQDLMLPLTYIYAATCLGTGLLTLRALLLTGHFIGKAVGYTGNWGYTNE